MPSFIKDMRVLPAAFSYARAFERNVGLVSKLEQERLRNATIGIPGMGGVGGIHAITLARMGIGNFHLADLDTFEIANFNRQFGAFVSTLGQSKVGTMESFLLDVNPEIKTQCWNEFIDSSNVDAFLEGCDILIDSIDAFCVSTRRLIFKRAQEKKIPIITAGPIGFGVAMLIFNETSMDIDSYFDFRDTDSERELFLKFMMGLCPKPRFLSYFKSKNIDLKNQRGPCIASSVNLCAGSTGAEVIKILLNRGIIYSAPYYHFYDPYLSHYKRGYLLYGNKNPIQRIKKHFIKKLFLGEK